MSEGLATILQGAGLAGVAFAAVRDVQSRIIPNRLVLWVLGLGLTSQFLSDGWGGGLSAGVALAVFLPLGLLAGRGVIGGGDAKMIAAVAALVAPGRVLDLLLAIAVAGGFLALAYLAARRFVRGTAPAAAGAPASLALVAHDVRRVADGEPLPFGVAILFGCAFVILRGLA